MRPLQGLEFRVVDLGQGVQKKFGVSSFYTSLTVTTRDWNIERCLFWTASVRQQADDVREDAWNKPGMLVSDRQLCQKDTDQCREVEDPQVGTRWQAA